MNAAAATVVLASFLAIIKAAVFGLTGSISILASCADSLLDVAASTVNYLAVRAAMMPPDEDHSYGHGKFEAVAGIFQSGVVAAAACFLLYSATDRFIHAKDLERLPLGIGVMSISMVTSLIIIYILKRSVKQSGSLALAGDALHYTSDVLANLATIVALILTQITGANFWDPAIALGLTAYLLVAAWRIFSPAWDILVDRQLSLDDIQKIEQSLRAAAPAEVIGYYGLRTRTSGRKHFADVRVVIASNTRFERVHDITEQLEAAVVANFKRAEVVIHPEPEGAHGVDGAHLTWSRALQPPTS